MRTIAVLSLITIAAALTLGQRANEPSDESNRDTLIARGEYITHRVAMCVQCHSPRDERGTIIQGRIFKGAPIPVPAPPYRIQDWSFQAPDIAGLVGYEGDVEFLMTGIVARTGLPPRPPMPPFRMNQEDAEAVVAYLKSLR